MRILVTNCDKEHIDARRMLKRYLTRLKRVFKRVLRIYQKVLKMEDGNITNS